MMGEMGIKFPDNIVFSNERNYILKNDFSFHIYKRSSDKSESVKKTRKGRKLAKIYIKGLERLFEDNGSSGSMMDIFAKSFHTNGNDEWSVSYGHFGQSHEKCLEIVCNASELEENFSVDFLLSREFEFNAKFKDEESIVLTVIFENFDIFFPDIENSVTANYFVIAKEMPYIDQFMALDMNGNKVDEVYNGKTVEITWSVGNVEKVSTSLCDENGEVLSNVAPYKVTIDRDRRFTLKAEKNGQVITKTLNIGLKIFNFPSDVDFFANDSWHFRTNAVYRTKCVDIKWSSMRGYGIKSYLCDENGEVLKEASGVGDYEELQNIKINRNRVFTLKIEDEGQVAYKTLNINATFWDRTGYDQDNAKIPFKSDGKTHNKILHVNCLYSIYMYPAWYISRNLKNWVKIDTIEDCPKDFDFYMGDVVYEGEDNDRYEKYVMYVYFYLCEEEKYVGIHYSIKIKDWAIENDYKLCKSEKIELISGRHTDLPIHFMLMFHYNKPNNICEVLDYDLALALMQKSKPYLTEISSHNIDMRNNISMDLLYLAETNELYIALLYKEYVVLYKCHYGERDYELINFFELDRQDQKNVFISYENKKKFIILDNYVFESNNTEIFNELSFSPKDTIKNTNDSDIFSVYDSEKGTSVIIVRDGEKACIWKYRPL